MSFQEQSDPQQDGRSGRTATAVVACVLALSGMVGALALGLYWSHGEGPGDDVPPTTSAPPPESQQELRSIPILPGSEDIFDDEDEPEQSRRSRRGVHELVDNVERVVATGVPVGKRDVKLRVRPRRNGVRLGIRFGLDGETIPESSEEASAAPAATE